MFNSVEYLLRTFLDGEVGVEVVQRGFHELYSALIGRLDSTHNTNVTCHRAIRDLLISSLQNQLVALIVSCDCDSCQFETIDRIVG